MTNRVARLLANLDYQKISTWFLAILGFSISFSPSIVSISLGFMVLLFLLEGKYKQRFSYISDNPLAYMAFLMVFLHVIGFLWTNDTALATQTLSRVWKFLLIPFFMMYIRRDNIAFLMSAFLLGMVVSELVSYSIWIGLIEPFGKATKLIPSPFMSYPYYTAFAALCAGLLINYLLFDRPKNRFKVILTIFFLTTILINLSFTGGRGGQVGFFALLFVFALIYYKGRWVKGILSFILVGFTLFTLAYQFMPIFKHRVDAGVKEVVNFKQGVQKGSVSIRLALNMNYFNAFLDAPLIGHGTGSYIKAYEKANEQSKYKTFITQPHNMYLLMLVQFGLVGGILFLAMFVYLLWYGWHNNDELHAFRLGFVFFWLTIMLVNWYLYSHHTLYLFLFLSSVLFAIPPKKILSQKVSPP